MAVAACCFVAVINWTPSSLGSSGARPGRRHSARMLLESSELADMATEQIMKTGHTVLKEHHYFTVRKLVAGGFRNLTSFIQQNKPTVYRQLTQLHLTDEQKAALLNQVHMTGDPRMQSIGRDIAYAVIQGRGQGREAVTRQLSQKLQPRLAEIRQLHEEFLPSALGGGHHEDSNFEMNIDFNNMHLLQSFDHSGGSMEVDMSRPEAGSETLPSRRLNAQAALLNTEESLGVIHGVIEQARIILDQMDDLSGVFGNTAIAAAIPDWSRSLVGFLDLTSGLVTCLIDGLGNPTLQMMCPMRYASSAMDMFRSINYLWRGGSHSATTTLYTTSAQLWPW